jgi:hypothetical protein
VYYFILKTGFYFLNHKVKHSFFNIYDDFKRGSNSTTQQHIYATTYNSPNIPPHTSNANAPTAATASYYSNGYVETNKYNVMMYYQQGNYQHHHNQHHTTTPSVQSELSTTAYYPFANYNNTITTTTTPATIAYSTPTSSVSQNNGWSMPSTAAVSAYLGGIDSLPNTTTTTTTPGHLNSYTTTTGGGWSTYGQANLGVNGSATTLDTSYHVYQ